MGVVEQSAKLLSGSIEENIMYGSDKVISVSSSVSEYGDYQCVHKLPLL